jgi:DNA modification methylase
VKIQKIEISKLTGDPANARKHGERNIQSIVESLSRFGQQKPIVVDKSNCVRAGNGTLEAARLLGWTHLDSVVTDLAGADAVAYAIADNRTAELAEWDTEILAAELESLQSDGLLEAAGFTDEELAAMLQANEPQQEIVEDDVPDAPVEPITKPGDLWILGRHRLLCGSCLDMAAMDVLFSGELASMVFTDPPYNVSYVGGTKEALTIKNDSMSDGDFLQFLTDAFVSLAAFTEPGGACYVCHADSEGKNFRQAFSASGFVLKQCLVWIKNSLVLGRQDYHWRHEPILYGWRQGASHRFYGNRKQTTVIDDTESLTVVNEGQVFSITASFGGKTVVLKAKDVEVAYSGVDEFETAWRFDKPLRNGDHPTMKPVRLAARAIQHGSRKDEIVLDGFMGSGTTLIACDQLSRRCFGTELDPKYCDVIVKRWENLTSEKAVCQSATPAC